LTVPDEMDRQVRLEKIEYIKNRIKLEQISSELDGLYEELDKIYKKAPEEQISNLTVENVNTLIKDTKEIIDEDPYINRVKEFVPAVTIGISRCNHGTEAIETRIETFQEANFAKYFSLSDLTAQLEQLESGEE